MAVLLIALRAMLMLRRGSARRGVAAGKGDRLAQRPGAARLAALAVVLAATLAGCGDARVERTRICDQALHAMRPGAETLGQRMAPGDTVAIRFRERGREHELVCGFTPLTLQSDGLSLIRVVTPDEGELSPTILYLLNRFGLEHPDTAAATRLPWWAYFLQQLANALAPSAIYALLAAGYAVIYGITGRINLAFGEFATVGAFTALSGVLLGASMTSAGPALALVGLALAAFTGGALGGALWTLVFAPLHRRNTQALLIATIGLAITLAEALRLLAGSRLRWLQPLFASPWHVGRLTLNPSQFILAALALIVVSVVGLTIRRTAFGRAYRAVSDDPGAAALVGVAIDRTIATACVLGSMLAGVAGYVIATHYGVVSFSMGTMLGLKALTAAVIGGIGSIPGAAVGGMMIGLLEGLWAGYLPGDYRDVAVFCALAATLALRPDGLLGRARASRQLPPASPMAR
ncbi:MAG: branched-chain amino acid ABC transporter permease [Geminicoccaceae bacterium]